MSNVTVKLHIETLTDSSYVSSFTAKITVASAEGITPCIFVHKYIPNVLGSSSSYEFMNVAYYDELESVPDYLKTRKEIALVRTSSIEKKLPNQAELEDFIATVQHDVQRLLVQIDTTTVSGLCRDVEITADTVVQTMAECSASSVTEPALIDKPASEVVSITYAGTTVEN